MHKTRPKPITNVSAPRQQGRIKKKEHKQRQQLMFFNDITFALDKDARKKSISAATKFFFGKKPNILLLEEDFKNMGEDQVKQVLFGKDQQ